MYVPPLELQQSFAEAVGKVHGLTRPGRVAEESAAKLSGSVMERLLASDG